jgi:hypothetical protein
VRLPDHLRGDSWTPLVTLEGRKVDHGFAARLALGEGVEFVEDVGEIDVAFQRRGGREEIAGREIFAEGEDNSDQGLGLRIVTVQIKEAAVSSSRLWENLQKPYRSEQARIARLAELQTEEAISEREMAASRLKETQRIENDRELAELRARNDARRFDAETTERLTTGPTSTVIHGPAITGPATTVAASATDMVVPSRRPPNATGTVTAKATRPAARTTRRRQVGRGRAVWRVTPSGDIRTRRSETTAATTASTGTPTAISAAGRGERCTSPETKAWPSTGIRTT